MSRDRTPEPEEKSCASCGRRIEWRKKWERDWDQVRYCSTACRRRGVSADDARLEAAILDQLARRATTTPEDADRAVAGDREPEAARRAARRLVAAGRAEVVQGGRVVDASTAKGAFTIRRVR